MEKEWNAGLLPIRWKISLATLLTWKRKEVVLSSILYLIFIAKIY